MSGATRPALSLQGISKHYRRGQEDVRALHGITLTVAPGEFVAITGPSGSGKTTLLQVAAGLVRPDRGRVVVGDADLAQLSAADRARLRRRTLGFVFQAFHLLPHLTVRENVALPLILDGEERTDERADAQLRHVGLHNRASHRPAQLSGGEQQRVAIARALVAEPRLIFADEPTGNLDSKMGAQVLSALTRRVKSAGAALVMATHDPAAATMADRIISLRDGRRA
jgi:putative ABC transport system ATP-binding protein